MDRYRMFFTNHENYGLGTRFFEANNDDAARGRADAWAAEHGGRVALYRCGNGDGGQLVGYATRQGAAVPNGH